MRGAFNYQGASGEDPPMWVINSFYKAGRVVWSPSDFQYFMAKVSHTSATDPASDPTNWQPTGERAINSIQRGTASTGSITISAVNMAKTELRWLGGASFNTGTLSDVPRMVLTSSTAITVSGTGSTSYSMAWELTERY